MGTINSNGIFVYDDTESLSPLSSYMNLQGSALSTRLAQDVRFKKVANEAARTAYVNEVGIANISAANPLAVHRQNAPEGLRFEVTYNGTTWDTIASKGYYDSQVFDQTVYSSGDASIHVRAVGKSVTVTFDGTRSWPSGYFGTIADGVIPVGLRPARQVTGSVMFRWNSVGVGVVNEYGAVYMWNIGPTNNLWLGSVSYTAA